MSECVQKSHNVSVLLYHFVCPAKYRRVVFSKAVDESLKDICLEISKLHPEVKDQLWGGEFWTKGYYVNTVGRHGDENTIQAYVQAQGKLDEYEQIHPQQLKLF